MRHFLTKVTHTLYTHILFSGNLDDVLDPKLTLSDYQITEIYVTTRGAILTQEISSSDIMALRREEERRQMAAKTGGGVFNLIFKRGKTVSLLN